MALDNIKKYGIKCDLEKNNSYLFAAYDVDKLDKMKKFLKKTKIKYEECDLPVNIPNINAIKVNDTFVFHPLKYITSLREIIIKSKVQIYENTRATSISFEKDYYKVTTLEGNIKAKKIIICTHYPFFVIPGLMPLRLSLEKSYALLSPYKNEKFNAINVDDEVYSVRFYKDNIIVGGFSHPLYKNINYKKEEDKLIYFYKKYFNKDIEMAWQTHDLTSHDYLPMIGRLNKNHPNLLIATAFNKWGMTNGILAGKILADLALNKQNKYADLFRLDRPISFTKVTNFITNNFMVGKTYIGTKLIKNKDFYKNVHIEMIDGKCSGIYNDENGEKHIVSNTCPHLKCSLIFNKLDKTWDCPCHGSRFDIDGNLLEGPSVFDIKLK